MPIQQQRHSARFTNRFCLISCSDIWNLSCHQFINSLTRQFRISCRTDFTPSCWFTEIFSELSVRSRIKNQWSTSIGSMLCWSWAGIPCKQGHYHTHTAALIHCIGLYPLQAFCEHVHQNTTYVSSSQYYHRVQHDSYVSPWWVLTERSSWGCRKKETDSAPRPPSREAVPL